MGRLKRFFSALITMSMFVLLVTYSVDVSAATPSAAVITGTDLKSSLTLSDGVKYTQRTAEANSVYGGTSGIEFNVVEVDMSETNLYLDNVYGGARSTHAWKYGLDIVSNFSGLSDKIPIAAVNADMWWMHTGSATEASNNDELLLRNSNGLAFALGFTMSGGEIYTSDRMPQESFTASNGKVTLGYSDMLTFGITSDYVPIMSNPNAFVTVRNTTRNITAEADGINRLPANNSLVMYTDKGCLNNYANDDAYEVKIQITSTDDYVIKHGTNISGKVVEIYGPDDSSNPTMDVNSNYIILTARGTRTDAVSGYKVGDTVNIQVSVSDVSGKHTAQWQTVTDAVSGRIPFAADGVVSPAAGLESNYPATVLGITNSGNVVMLTLGAAAEGVRRGIDPQLYDELAKDLDLKDAFLLDGSGSSTMIILDETEYKIVNNPSDTNGEPRQLLNMLVLSVGSDRDAQGDMPSGSNKTANAASISFENEANLAYVSGAVNDTKYYTQNGALKLISVSGNDPYMSINYMLSSPKLTANKYKYLTVEYMLPTTNSSAAKAGQIFYQVGNATNADSRYVTDMSALIRDGKYHTAVIDFSNVKNWSGSINAIRIDYFNACSAGDTMYIKSLTLTSENPAPAPGTTADASSSPTKIPTVIKTPTAASGATASNGSTQTNKPVSSNSSPTVNTPDSSDSQSVTNVPGALSSTAEQGSSKPLSTANPSSSAAVSNYAGSTPGKTDAVSDASDGAAETSKPTDSSENFDKNNSGDLNESTPDSLGEKDSLSGKKNSTVQKEESGVPKVLMAVCIAAGIFILGGIGFAVYWFVIRKRDK